MSADGLEILDLLQCDITYKGEPFRPMRLAWDPETKTLTADFMPSEIVEEYMKKSADIEVTKTAEP